MEENVQQLLKDKNEDIVQFNFENNTSSPIAIDLFDTASLLTIPTSGNPQTTYTPSNDLLPSLPPSLFALNPNNGTFIASDLTTPILRIVNTNTNTNQSNFNNFDGFSSAVNSIVSQPDGKIICGGAFLSYKGVSSKRIIRLNSDGSIDTTFVNGTSFNGIAYVIALQSDGKIFVGGFFTSYNGVSANRIIRLNSDGSIDTTFVYGTGFDNVVYSIEIQPDGKILCGGDFNTYKGIVENGIIRLNPDGTKDLTFDNSIGFNNGVSKISIQTDGKILVGGNFTTYKGITENGIIRLNSNGSKDLTFDNSIGFSAFGVIYSMPIQSDGKIICSGNFLTYKGVSANYIIRLNSNGSIDSTFNYGTGFDNYVNSVLIQPDGKIIVGGFYTTYQGLPENYIIRLNADGSKDLTFDNSIGFDLDVISMELQSNGDIFLGGNFTTYNNWTNNRIVKLNTNGFSASTLNLGGVGGNFNDIIYNSNNNVFYGINGNDLYVINSDGQSIQNIFALGGISITYNSNNNYLYILRGLTIRVFDCATNLIVTNISLGGGSSSFLSEVTPSNEIYYFDNTFNLLQKINCLTNTLVPINISLPNIFTSNGLPYYNGYLYVYSNSSNIIDIVDTNTDTYFNSITIPTLYTFNPFYSAINPITNQLFITDFNLNRQFAVIDLPTNTLVSVNTLSGIGGTYGVIYNSLTDSMYISGSLFSVVTFTATPFFIGGSTNYNTFVNSLNFEPIFVDEIRILTQNQTQLYNQVQFTKIDSNGNQIFFPEFPITKVDSYQQQGNIAGLKLNGLVFDGRTYINQYVINPNQIVSFEIYYKQLDRFSATPTFPIFFKPKIQLKEYIRKDYNNYDIEM